MYNGLFGVTRLCNAQTRSITAENVDGEKGRGGMAEFSVESPVGDFFCNDWSTPPQPRAREEAARFAYRAPGERWAASAREALWSAKAKSGTSWEGEEIDEDN
jgi:hypothetical protein